MLERRLNKLNGVLEDREKEIQRLKTAVATDEGVASMYKDVQGIDSDDEKRRGQEGHDGGDLQGQPEAASSASPQPLSECADLFRRPALGTGDPEH